MNIAMVWNLLQAAHAACGQRDYVVVGSLSILGMEQVADIPPGMTMSVDVDCYTLADPPRIFDLQASLGEGSAFHASHGFYLDPVSPKLPTLPDGWERRCIQIEHEGLRAHFLEPHDAAISKLARGEPRDTRWVRSGLRAGLLTVPVLALRMKSTAFLDEAEERGTRSRMVSLGLKKRDSGD